MLVEMITVLFELELASDDYINKCSTSVVINNSTDIEAISQFQECHHQPALHHPLPPPLLQQS